MPVENPTQIDIVFCFWSYNDIDHSVPIIYKINKDHKNIEIRCVIFDLYNDYRSDFRINYLKSLGIDVCHIVDMIGIEKNLVRGCFDRKYRDVTNLFTKIGSIFANKFIYSKINALVSNTHKLLAPDIFFDQAFGGNKSGILVFDHQVNLIYRKLTEYAKINNFLTVSIPHAPDFGTDCDLRSWSIDERALTKVQPFPYDYVIQSNIIQKDNMIRRGLCCNSENIVLGSARFSQEWNKKLHFIVPKLKLPVTPSSGTLKIVLMATKPEGRLYKEELDRVIQFICKFPGVFLVIKSHTRGEMYDVEGIENLKVVGNEVHSPSLIEWADLTLFTHSSVVLDNIREDKAVLFLRRVVQDKMGHELITMSWSVRCQEELRDYMWKFIHNKKSRTYTEEERIFCLKAFVEPNNRDVLGDYASFFLTQFEQLRK